MKNQAPQLDERHRLGMSLLILAVIVLQSCASPANSDNMVPKDAVVGRGHGGAVNVAVSGGHETNPLWVSKVSNADFQKAVEASLLRYKLFSQIIRNKSAEYRLEVELKELKQPFAGFNMTVKTKVHWQLTNTKTGKIVWQQEIDRQFTATMGQAFYGVHRLELANEGAVRENIKAAVEQLGKISL